MKRVTIYVDGDKWKDVKEASYQKRISAGDYLMGLHGDYLRGSSSPSYSDIKIDPAPKVDDRDSDIIVPAVDTIKSRAISRGRANLGRSDPVGDMAEKIKKIPKGVSSKKPKKSLPVGCVECRAPFGHRVGCPLGGA